MVLVITITVRQSMWVPCCVVDYHLEMNVNEPSGCGKDHNAVNGFVAKLIHMRSGVYAARRKGEVVKTPYAS